MARLTARDCLGYDVTMLRPLILPLFVLLGCAAPEEDTSSGSNVAIEVSIDSPGDGDRFDWDEKITLEVSAKEGQKKVDLGAVTWTVDDRELRGESAEVANLDPGDYTVEVDVVVGGEHYGSNVEITVKDRPDDTGDTGDTGTGGPGTYAGTMATHVWYDGEYGEFDGDCPGTVNFTVSESGVIDGTGKCSLDGQYDMDFRLDGSQSGSNISGTLIAESDGTEYRTPYTGTGKEGGHFAAEYDKTFQTGGDSLRIAGSWAADPQ